MGQRVNENDPPGSIFNLITAKAIEYFLIRLELVTVNAKDISIEN
jgi:hypothetical protein